ncbi:hypothetical protein [Sphingomonas montanisoli]|uniref:Uncharacterized protein n=1 Tax=Sphingomonas montanisoli TaxID=2606412 RepID=A0A5D9C0E3_9SPHN|nr:hypothetical protein [Sphingomonas montanisoli]TZG24893.1 hypothetical protein FYJ91_16570 [Sphingomonas montanisoli]
MSTTFAAAQIPQTTGWRQHDGRACPTNPLALVKVQFRGESIEAADKRRATPAYTWDWMLPTWHAPIAAWRPANELTLAQRLLAEAEPWLAGMASRPMRIFITFALIVAAAAWVALLVEMTS